MADSKVPFVDLRYQWREIKNELMPALERLFESSAFSLGPAVDAFEVEFAKYTGAAHAVGLNSGTSALHLAILAAGIGPGDSVIVPAHTFVGTAWGVIYAGATPIFADVDYETGTIDIEDAARRIRPNTRAIIPVHLYGQAADMTRVADFAAQHGLTIIEDAAQAHGATYRGTPVGRFGAMACYSFYPGKNLGAAGEAGAITTDDEALAARIRVLRNHGQQQRYLHEEVGYNYRMEGIQGLVLSHKLARLPHWTALRRRVAKRYLEALSDLPIWVPLPRHGDHVYHLFVICHRERDAIRKHLDARGIQTGLHYPIPLHRQPCFKSIMVGERGADFPVADRFANECLSLPIYAGMTDLEVDAVIEGLRAYFK